MRGKKVLSFIFAFMVFISNLFFSSNLVSANKYEDFAVSLDRFYYAGDDLGAIYSRKGTTFKVWAPTASSVILRLYRTGSDEETNSGIISETNLEKSEETGVWYVYIEGDVKNIYYTYLITVDGKTKETTDVYSKAVGVNGKRSMVVDLKSTNPEGWDADKHVYSKNPTDAIVWEVHVRDFSIHSSSGVLDKYKGKYLAFKQRGTTLNNEGKIPTCLDYLVDQGVNYVQLLPISDYETVDERSYDPLNYNWGYDPQNYNVPEGSYSTDPYNGEVRINEFKQMVKTLHDNGIGIIMDVVFNHTYTTDSCFERTVPGYYYRMREDGTFCDGSCCSNVTASNHKMFRKYMVDSIKYWIEEYHIDGFRFDLMGCHDITTMNMIREEVDKLDGGNGKNIILYGEPWAANLYDNGIDSSEAAIQRNLHKLSNRIGGFNDAFRDSLKGSTDGCDCAYIQGCGGFTRKIQAGITGNTSDLFGNNFSRCPSQTVSYVSAHDNLTLYDKIVKSQSRADYIRYEDSVKINKLCEAIIMTSQGISFSQAGEEFCRTKWGDNNSYKSSDFVNSIDWNNIVTFSDSVEYKKGLNKIRKAYSPFRDSSKKSIETSFFSYKDVPDNVIAYTLHNESCGTDGEWETVAVIINPNNKSERVSLQSTRELPSSWVVIADDKFAGTESLGCINSTRITINPQSVMILVDKDSFYKSEIA